jgi:hypothetical protein
MLSLLRRLLARSAESKRRARYNDGWNWAAGQLLLRIKPDDVLAYVDCARMFEDGEHPFDKGAEDAVRQWRTVRVNNEVEEFV